MGRNKGIFNLSANYEPLIAAPLDARTVVGTRQDLIVSTTWVSGDASLPTPYLFNGLLVCVTQDPTEAYNGVYMLLNADKYTTLDSWMKIAEIRDINELNAKIDSIVPGGGTGVIPVGSRGQLPSVGAVNSLYVVQDENAVYRWDDVELKYYCVGRDYQEVQVINGGNAETI